uniref:Uncharacterized protein n=1 Tax=Molossus molossus TaxID=27622 RepID=A0A7J8GR07_MOLMO|nr:hypothetical protein HJG59_011398 [Molossus molossus]
MSCGQQAGREVGRAHLPDPPCPGVGVPSQLVQMGFLRGSLRGAGLRRPCPRGAVVESLVGRPHAGRSEAPGLWAQHHSQGAGTMSTDRRVGCRKWLFLFKVRVALVGGPSWKPRHPHCGARCRELAPADASVSPEGRRDWSLISPASWPLWTPRLPEAPSGAALGQVGLDGWPPLSLRLPRLQGAVWPRLPADSPWSSPALTGLSCPSTDLYSAIPVLSAHGHCELLPGQVLGPAPRPLGPS